jgi:hypothetical protein
LKNQNKRFLLEPRNNQWATLVAWEVWLRGWLLGVQIQIRSGPASGQRTGQKKC